jgi:demethylmenaquinone methyltransferase/2-methoxy-6-polyprenyl-1,4-benzoquinol methylase
MQPDLSPMQSYYASRAGEYDRVYAKPERQRDLREIERWLPSVLRGEAVLEVACGTGYWTQFIAPVAASVLAIDSAPEMLRIAKQRVEAGIVTFEVGDAYALPRRPDVFTAAFAGFWFSHVPLGRQAEFLVGLNASLQSGARVVLLDNLFVEGSSSAISERDPAGNTYQSRKLGDGSTHRVLKNFPTEAQLLSLGAAGVAASAAYRCWEYFWAFEYRVPAR